MSALEKLEAICDEIFERWDKDQRAGKLLSALAGRLSRYRDDVTEVRAALAGWQPIETLHRIDTDVVLWNPCDGVHLLNVTLSLQALDLIRKQGVFTHWRRLERPALIPNDGKK